MFNNVLIIYLSTKYLYVAHLPMITTCIKHTNYNFSFTIKTNYYTEVHGNTLLHWYEVSIVKEVTYIALQIHKIYEWMYANITLIFYFAPYYTTRFLEYFNNKKSLVIHSKIWAHNRILITSSVEQIDLKKSHSSRHSRICYNESYLNMILQRSWLHSILKFPCSYRLVYGYDNMTSLFICYTLYIYFYKLWLDFAVSSTVWYLSSIESNENVSDYQT
jgi:hypothetical protein